MKNLEDLLNQIKLLSTPGYRRRLVSRGLARSMVWRNGQLPLDAPEFAYALSADLLDHAFILLRTALAAIDRGATPEEVQHAFYITGESIESVVRHGEEADPLHGFHTIIASVVYHLSGYSARSFNLIAKLDLDGPYLSAPERMVGLLLKRVIQRLELDAIVWVNNLSHSPTSLADRDTDEHDLDSIVLTGINRRLIQSIGVYEYALHIGDLSAYKKAKTGLEKVTSACAEVGAVRGWWLTKILGVMMDDLWKRSLHEQIPHALDDADNDRWRDLRRRYIQLLVSKKVAEVDLWPSQLEAASRISNQDDDLVIALPTSAGKTRIAELAILSTLSRGKRCVYVTPLRALSAQIEAELASKFRPLGFRVSSMYGASGVSRHDLEAAKGDDVVVATPEKLDFALRQEPSSLDDVGLLVLDEGHMIGEGSREVRYESLIQRILRRRDAHGRRIVCLSAVFSNNDLLDDFTSWLRDDSPGAPVVSDWRPTRQRFGTVLKSGRGWKLQLEVGEEAPFLPAFVTQTPPRGRRKRPFPADQKELNLASAVALHEIGHAVLIFCPEKRSVEGVARDFVKAIEAGYLTVASVSNDKLNDVRRIAIEWLGSSHIVVKALHWGIGIHHGDLPRPVLARIEDLLKEKVLKFVVASPTVAQGLNLSCSALVLHSLYRSGTLIPPKEFGNVIGRVGRAFVDVEGLIVYPIVERSFQYKLGQFNELRTRLIGSDIESSLFLLLRTAIGRLADEEQIPYESALEYILNNRPDIGEFFEKQKEDTGDVYKDIKLLDEIDNAILSMVEDLSVGTDKLDEIIDEVLTRSLWARRAERHDPIEKRAQREVLVCRARQMWNCTTEVERVAYYRSGVGSESGRTLFKMRKEVIDLLAKAEAQIAFNEVWEASQTVTELAKFLWQVNTFSPQHLHSDWKAALTSWLSGEGISHYETTEGVSVNAFIQQDVVYRLVWGIEAIRNLSASADALTADPSLGVELGVLLTHGVPMRSAALLLQLGLPSRAMAMKVAGALELQIASQSAMVDWLKEFGGILGQEFWTTEDDLRLWQKFLRSLNDEYSNVLEFRSDELAATFERVYEGPIRLMRDPATGRFAAFSPTFVRIAEIDEAPTNLPEKAVFGYALERAVRVEWLGA